MGRIIFKGANLLDGEKPARPGMTIVVDGEYIKEVQAGDGPTPTPDDRVVDLAGKTVMPGMISCHFHAAYSNIGASPAPIGLSHPPLLPDSPGSPERPNVADTRFHRGRGGKHRLLYRR